MGRALDTVYEASDSAELLWVETVLRAAGISYNVTNEELQNLFGAGPIGGFNLVTGPIRIEVAPHDAERARLIVEEGRTLEPAPRTTARADAEAQPSELEQRAARYSRLSLVLGLLYLGGIGSVFAIGFGLKALTATRMLSTRSRVAAISGIVAGGAGLVFSLLVAAALLTS